MTLRTPLDTCWLVYSDLSELSYDQKFADVHRRALNKAVSLVRARVSQLMYWKYSRSSPCFPRRHWHRNYVTT